MTILQAANFFKGLTISKFSGFTFDKKDFGKFSNFSLEGLIKIIRHLITLGLLCETVIFYHQISNVQSYLYIDEEIY